MGNRHSSQQGLITLKGGGGGKSGEGREERWGGGGRIIVGWLGGGEWVGGGGGGMGEGLKYRQCLRLKGSRLSLSLSCLFCLADCNKN